ncbi:hypothetical protein ATM97_19265 [Nocardia sp. MH4]|uniref:hypothetical protein n=1 Tax=unclassified Nocardia TaxID=2637762 RepID=UPI001C4F81DC|nr:hypothetical protein [Nocardia sp. MH4]MBW0275567.1 hypothetical protein [Nocardia sp. MH4]
MLSNIDPAEWTKLDAQAAAGQLSIDPAVGTNLARVCDDHLDALETVLTRLLQIEQITGFGSFNSSKILENKFSQTAAGGDRSLRDTITQHIEAVTTAKEVVLKAIANFQAQDDDNAGQYTGLGGN